MVAYDTVGGKLYGIQLKHDPERLFNRGVVKEFTNIASVASRRLFA